MSANRFPGQNGLEPLGGNPEDAFLTGHSTGIEALSELGVHDIRAERRKTDTDEKTAAKDTQTDEKKHDNINDEISRVPDDEETIMPIGKGMTAQEKVENMEEIALYALHVEDDPSLDPWTFRTWALGIGLSGFSATLATIYQFKPQGITLSATFLCVISYVLALVLEQIPKIGVLRWLNPHPFNAKEHAAILIMSSTAAHSALAVEVIAVQRLWYEKAPNAGVCIFLIFASQLLGYGIAGLMRKILVYPTKASSPFFHYSITTRNTRFNTEKQPVSVSSKLADHVAS